MIEGRSENLGRRIRLGMVGGGEGAFIGAVHRMAARLDDQYELVAGALSSTPEKSRRSAAGLGIAPDRAYDDFAAMAKAEAARPDGIEAVAIVTPNHMHAPAALAFLEAGIHVISDKPLTTSLAEAQRLQDAARKSGLIFALTHNYTGYPLIRHARSLVEAGELGDIRIVQVEYPQDWLTNPIEGTGHKQAEWRADPARAGAGGAIGDIGTHAYNLADFVVGIEVEQLCAQLTSFVPGRRLDDDVQVMLRYRNGARGFLWASQVAVGQENGLRLRVYGAKAGLEWCQNSANEMLFSPYGESTRIVTRAGPEMNAAGRRATRVPPGHPEGYVEAFAVVYKEIAAAIRAARDGKKPPEEVTFPTVDDGVKGLAFIQAAVTSSQAGSTWVKV